MSYKIGIIGGGGRESALAEAYAKSGHVSEILAFPGNDLMQLNSEIPVRTYPDISVTQVNKIVDECLKQKVYLVDVAQEDAIAAGAVDELEKAGIIAIGPTKEAGRIEWDKAWARELGEDIGLSQPLIGVCRSSADAKKFLAAHPEQAWFVKASGLAQGKGVLPAVNSQEALDKVTEMKRFGRSGDTFLLESWLVGEEFSSFAFCDGTNYTLVGSAQDHKRINDYDQGENTGGMGAATPPLAVDSNILKEVRNIFDKTVRELGRRKIPYKGILYLGGIKLDKGSSGAPYIIEFNSRWGDPEAEVILPGIKNNYFDIVMAIYEGRIGDLDIKTDGMARVAVAGVSRGYPGDYSNATGKRIYGIEEANALEGVTIYGAGVKQNSGQYYSGGGRLFYVVGSGKTVIDARRKAYEAMSMLSIEGNNLHYRTDIGWRDLARLRSAE